MLYFYKRDGNYAPYPYVLRTAPPGGGVSAMWTPEGCGEFPKEVLRFVEEHHDAMFKRIVGVDMRGWVVLTEEQFHSILNFAQTLNIECLIEDDLQNERRTLNEIRRRLSRCN